MGKGHLRKIQMNKLALQVAEMQKAYREWLENPEAEAQKLTMPLRIQLQNNEFQLQRLSALCAALIENAGGKVVLQREDLEKFNQNKITIGLETNEEATEIEKATTLTFTFKAEPLEPPAPVATAPEPLITVDGIDGVTPTQPEASA